MIRPAVRIREHKGAFHIEAASGPTLAWCNYARSQSHANAAGLMMREEALEVARAIARALRNPAPDAGAPP